MSLIDKLEALFVDKSSSGVYFLDSNISIGKLADIAGKDKYAYVFMNGKSILDKESFIQTLADKMNFPDYFGENWDALEECLRDLDWFSAGGYIVVYDHFEVFEEKEPKEFKVALEIFQSAIDYWKELGIPMYFLLSGKETIATKHNVPKLSSVLKKGGSRQNGNN